MSRILQGEGHMENGKTFSLLHKKKEGMRPGALVYVGDTECEETLIKTYWYDQDACTVESGYTPKETEMKRWIHISGLQDIKKIVTVAKEFSLSNLSLEDVFSTDQRMKIDYYDSYFSLTMRILDTERKPEEQLSLFIGTNWILSISEHQSDTFEPVVKHLVGEGVKLRSASPHLLFHALIDRVIDQYLVRADELEAKTEALEELVVNTPEKSTAPEIYTHKRRILHLRRMTLPLKDILTNLMRNESITLDKSTQFLLRDAYDHAIWLSEECEMLRDTVTGVMEVYLSSLDMRMNKIMKVLTIISTIFIPLTFITGLYGMNFLHMPFTNSFWGFYVMLFCCILVAVLMTGWFKRKQWW